MALSPKSSERKKVVKIRSAILRLKKNVPTAIKHLHISSFTILSPLLQYLFILSQFLCSRVLDKFRKRIKVVKEEIRSCKVCSPVNTYLPLSPVWVSMKAAPYPPPAPQPMPAVYSVHLICSVDSVHLICSVYGCVQILFSLHGVHYKAYGT